MPEPWPNILGGLTEAVCGSGVFGLMVGVLVTYFAFRLQQARRLVEYDAFFVPLLQFRPTPGGPLVVSVDKSLLTGNEADKGHLVPVDNAYGFRVEFENVGNQPAENWTADIQLDKRAKVIEWDTDPKYGPGFPIKAERDSSNLNVLRVSVPYVNQGKQVIVDIVSTGNTSAWYNVEGMGLGVEFRKRSRERGMPVMVPASLLAAGAFLLLALLSRLFVQPRLSPQYVDLAKGLSFVLSLFALGILMTPVLWVVATYLQSGRLPGRN